MLKFENLSRVEARRGPGALGTFDSLYGREWETCAGSEGMAADVAAEWIEFSVCDDLHDDPSKGKHGPVTQYRFVPGFVIDDADWHQAETDLGRKLEPVEVLAWINQRDAVAAADDVLTYATGV